MFRTPGPILQWHQINMAASPPSDVIVRTTDEEIHSAMETGECLVTENTGEQENEDVPKPEQDVEDPFKKPALFAAPSLTSKRSNVTAASKPSRTETAEENGKGQDVDTASETSSSAATESKSSGNGEEDDKGGKKEKNAAPVKTKPESKARVLPAKGPPAVKFPPLPYTEPSWGGSAPDMPYALEILKNGTIVDTVPLTHRGYFVVGRLPVCDVSLEHPSISRYHAVIQYRAQSGEAGSVGEERGFYVHDLGSTHGTVVNKNKIPPKTYIRLHVGHVLKFGGSTRLFILQVKRSKVCS